MSCRSFYQVPSLGAEERTFRDIRKIHAYSPLHSYVRYSNSRCESERKDRSKARRRPGRFWPLGARQSRARTSVVYDAQSAAVSSACRLCYSFFASRYVDLSLPSPLSLYSLWEIARARSFVGFVRLLVPVLERVRSLVGTRSYVKYITVHRDGATVLYPISRITSLLSRSRACGQSNTEVLARLSFVAR